MKQNEDIWRIDFLAGEVVDRWKLSLNVPDANPDLIAKAEADFEAATPTVYMEDFSSCPRDEPVLIKFVDGSIAVEVYTGKDAFSSGRSWAPLPR